MKLFDHFFDADYGFDFLVRYAHVISGITWIGLLYFFNFIQTPAYAKFSDGARSEGLRLLTLRALWWFRFAALFTFLFGIVLMGIGGHGDKVAGKSAMEIWLSDQHGTAILTGMRFGITMFLNVWGVIWVNQKIVIGSAQAVADGGAANPDAAAAGKKGARASRTNTLMSIPMLFFMVFAVHGSVWFGGQVKGTIVYWVIVLLIWAFLEGSALGLIGGIDSPWNKFALDDHKKTIIMGFVVWAVIYFIGWEALLAP